VTRRLRRAVLQFNSCLDDVSSLQRRVLRLRAGVGAGPPRSRRGVARRLELRPRRVMRLERTGLRKVRSLARGGSCGGGGGGGVGAPSGGAASGAGGADGGGSPLLASADGASGSAGAGDSSAGSGSTSGSGSGGSESGGVRGESDTRPPELFSGGGDGTGSSVPGGTPIVIALALVLLAALAGFAAPQVGRRVRSG
jgi:hypothetical protein